MKKVISSNWEYAWVLGDKWYFAKVKKTSPKTYDAIIGEFYWEDIPKSNVKFPKDERETNQFRADFGE